MPLEIDRAALDRAVRRCPLLLSLARRRGVDDTLVRSDVAVLLPLIVGYYRTETRELTGHGSSAV